MKFFRYDDFHNVHPSDPPGYIRFYDAAELANAKLDRESKVAYGYKSAVDIYWTTTNQPSDTHKAILINVEPIKKHACPNTYVCGDCFKKFELVEKKPECMHPPEKVRSTEYSKDEYAYSYQCSCGAKVVPSGFEVVNE